MTRTARETYDAVRASRLVAILRAEDPGLLVAGAEVLVEAGVTTLELPLTSPDALTAISRTVASVGDRASVGAGTVRTLDDLAHVVDVGARFVVSPALSVAVVEGALAAGLAAFPGVMTPTEYETARAAGAEVVKLFPAETVGPSFLRHLRVPFPDLEAVPTAGVGLQDAAAWFEAGAVALGVGSPLTGRFLADGDLDGLRELARAWKAAVS